EVIEKTQYDAFFHTDLEAILNAAGIKRLVLTGVMTHLCVETTARAAFTRGFEVFVPADAVATFDSQLQEGSLRAMAHGFAVPLLSGDILGVMI
ncbi:MAG TPA: isochorismatase family cysteine hydrolase, partial [Candidatus Krumholzibacterium sp.]|nr:isochorismatase family cysteine hydrolase [Candidatus Krumholzibacterium sp.]